MNLLVEFISQLVKAQPQFLEPLVGFLRLQVKLFLEFAVLGCPQIVDIFLLQLLFDGRATGSPLFLELFKGRIECHLIRLADEFEEVIKM